MNPASGESVKPEQLEPIFSKELIRQEVSMERRIPIPEEVRQIYRLWRPTPLYRATRLERLLKTPAHIYYKYEGVSPPGSHKPNTAVAQAYYNCREGTEQLTTETGAGQWGSSLAFADMLFDLKTIIYMVRASYDQKPYRRVMMQLYGAEVYPSPSNRTEAGKKFLAQDPNNPGSLGIAISEAVEECVRNERTKYTLGSVLNHVLTHQTVIGLETLEQLKEFDEYPDGIIGCVGGGSSLSGLFWPFYYEKKSGRAPKPVEFVAVEPTASPSFTGGEYLYDHGDSARIIPLAKMYTLGHDFIPDPIHAGGLRYHGKAPSLSLLVNKGEVEVKAYNQVEVFNAAATFTKAEGFIPAPEPAHAIKAVMDEALRCRETGEEKTLLFLLCGHGYFDMKAYDDFLQGKLPPYEYPKDKIMESMERLKKLYPQINRS